jgi:hypothetical protein
LCHQTVLKIGKNSQRMHVYKTAFETDQQGNLNP